MLFIYAGEDQAAAHQNYVLKQVQLRSEGYELISINRKKFSELESWLSDAQLLFSQKIAYCLPFCPGVKKEREVLANFQNESALHIVLYDPDHYQRDLKTWFPKASIMWHKLPTDVFAFLDSLVPGNGTRAVKDLDQLKGKDNEVLLFTLIRKRLKDLLLLSNGLKPAGRLQGWQLDRLTSQASRWDPAKLKQTYRQCYRIDRAIKTGETPYGYIESVQLLLIAAL
jgi:hypothetical protein